MQGNRNRIPYKGQTCLYFEEFGDPTRRCYRNADGKRYNKSKRDRQFAPVKSIVDELYDLAAANRRITGIRDIANKLTDEIKKLEETL